jgi:hypothetical protein
MVFDMPKLSKIALAGGVVLLLSAWPLQSESVFRFVVWGDATDLGLGVFIALASGG